MLEYAILRTTRTASKNYHVFREAYRDYACFEALFTREMDGEVTELVRRKCGRTLWTTTQKEQSGRNWRILHQA
jgi:hypothetical protein